MLRTAMVFLLLTGAASAADITTLAGKKYSGAFVGIADGKVNITTDAGPLAIPVKEMSAIDFGTKPVSFDNLQYDDVELTDSSHLRIGSLKIAGKKFVPTAILEANAPVMDIPLECVFWWQRNAHEPKNRTDWQKLLASRGKRDLFVIRQANDLSPVPGTILGGDDDGSAINFELETDNRRVSFKLVRATGGLVFNQPPRGVIPTTLCKLHDTLGNTLIVTSITGSDALTVKTVSGATFTYPSRAAIAKLDFSTGNVAYLAELEADVSAPEPVLGEPNWTYLKDRTPASPGFKLDGVAYSRGLWIAPDVSLAFKLNGDFREFKTVAGIDDSIQIASSAVRLTIEADGRPVFSEVIARKAKPRELTLDVKNVKLLKLIVVGEGLFLGNQLNLAEARLQK